VLVDTHCHLGDAAFDADRDEVVARARAAGVGAVVVVADGLDTFEAARRAAGSREGWAASAGIHPHKAASFDSGAAVRLEQLIGSPAVAAVGETGLDYHYDNAPRDLQRESFAWHLAAAARFGKPAIVHAREADAEVARLISDAPAGASGVMHSFSGSPELLEAALERGFYVSFSGMVTFRSWRDNRSVERVPDDRLLVETDAPYLAPAPHRGRRNEPAYLVATARRVAEIRGASAEHVARVTTANAIRCFGLRIPDRIPGPFEAASPTSPTH
jgi:TatD DNase family protein